MNRDFSRCLDNKSEEKDHLSGSKDLVSNSIKRSSEDMVDLTSDEVHSSKVDNNSESYPGFLLSPIYSTDLTPSKSGENYVSNAFVEDGYSCTLKKKIKVEEH